jgi:hypothetical protein
MQAEQYGIRKDEECQLASKSIDSTSVKVIDKISIYYVLKHYYNLQIEQTNLQTVSPQLASKVFDSIPVMVMYNQINSRNL